MEWIIRIAWTIHDSRIENRKRAEGSPAACFHVIAGVNQTNDDFYWFTQPRGLQEIFPDAWRRFVPVDDDTKERRFQTRESIRSCTGYVRRVKCLRDRITRSILWFKFVVLARANIAGENP